MSDRSGRQPTLFMTRGLPASGKSTWAEQQLATRPHGSVVRINKDLLRTMLHADLHNNKTEKQILAARDRLVCGSLQDGLDVIVDDTNLNPFHETRLQDLAQSCDAVFEVVDFTHITVQECVRRDLARARTVGSQVIYQMYRQYLHVTPQPLTPPEGAPRAVICDIDGTLAKMNGRSPYAWHQVASDLPIQPIVELVRLLAAAGIVVVYMSGRDGVCFDQTRLWLDTHVQVPGELFMRPAGDNRSDEVVKHELFDLHVRNRFDVCWVLDDRDRVVRLWRDTIGLTCLQVAPGDF